LKPAPGKWFSRPYFEKYPTHKKRAGGMAQAVERLLSHCEALSSNTSTTKTKKAKQENTKNSINS
jgi:hypothetical protein